MERLLHTWKALNCCCEPQDLSIFDDEDLLDVKRNGSKTPMHGALDNYGIS